MSSLVAHAQETTGAGIWLPRELTVGVKEAPPFAMKQADGSWQGISIDLWRRIAEDGGLRFHFAEEATVAGLIDGIADGKFDAAVAAITVTASRERVVDFTHAYYVTGLGIAVPAEGVMSWMPVARAITSLAFIQAVLVLVGLALTTGVAVWLCERRRNETFAGSVSKGLTSSVWWSTLAMTQRSPTGVGPMTLPGRLIAIVWMVTSIIVLAVFTAGVTSVLTTKQLQGVVNGVTDLASVRIGTVSGTTAEETLARMSIGSTGFTSPLDGLRALKAGEIDAFVYDRPLLAWHIHQHRMFSVKLLDAVFDPQSYAFALPNGSPLRERLSIAILTNLQGDWWTQVRFRYLGAS
jgi:ABC-type amino acid transport substrate-binding protein